MFDDISPLTTLTSLHTLILDGRELTNQSLSILASSDSLRTTLRHLEFFHCDVTDDCIASIVAFKHLHVLKVQCKF
ncbi:hypothetical protein, partial [Klebsiella pneumoniae]|uniref:hypothetical protein n=1 Tax=Klebsiella pneumoniae TaxID=573 RepID=UPI0030F43B2E